MQGAIFFFLHRPPEISNGASFVFEDEKLCFPAVCIAGKSPQDELRRGAFIALLSQSDLIDCSVHADTVYKLAATSCFLPHAETLAASQLLWTFKMTLIRCY